MIGINIGYGFKQTGNNIVFTIVLDQGNRADSFKIFLKIEDGKLVDITNKINEETCCLYE